MTSIYIPPNDEGLQRLRIDNRAPRTAAPVAEVKQPAHVAELAPPHLQPAPGRRFAIRRSRKTRRHRQDRRQSRLPVLLDTRSGHERRQHADEDSPVTGIDVMA